MSNQSVWYEAYVLSFFVSLNTIVCFKADDLHCKALYNVLNVQHLFLNLLMWKMQQFCKLLKTYNLLVDEGMTVSWLALSFLITVLLIKFSASVFFL
jgi:hypothetical protein